MAFRHILTVLLLFVMVTSLIGIRPEGSVTEYVGKLVSQRLRRISRRSAVLNTPGGRTAQHQQDHTGKTLAVPG
jgi:hypothetical protein